MNTESQELVNVKKSCKIVSIVLNVVKIIFIVGAILSLIGGIYCFSNRDAIDKQIASDIFVDFSEGLESNITTNVRIGNISYAMNDKIDNGEFGLVFGIDCLAATFICLVCTIVSHLFGSIFKTIQKSDTPFTSAILKKLKISFIIIAVVLFLFSGLGTGAIAAIIFWALYTIFQYGCALQKQSDETL